MNDISFNPKELARELYHDPHRFCTALFPHVFTEPIPWIHRGILYLLLDTPHMLKLDPQADIIRSNFVWDDGKECFDETSPQRKSNTLILMPGGFGKTCLAGMIIPLRELIYQNSKFTCYITSSAGDGKNQAHSIRAEIEYNERIRAVYGDLRGNRWSGNFMELANGQGFATRGYGHAETQEKVRGITWSGSKPDLMLIDGISTRINMSTDKQREELRSWFFSEVVPSVAPKGRIILLDTLRHSDSLSEHLIYDNTWNVLRLSALDKAGNPTWPYMADRSTLEERRRSYALGNQLHIFKMEYFNQPQNEESTGLLDEIDNERDEFINQILPYAEAAEQALLQSISNDREA